MMKLPVAVIYKECDECPHEFEVEMYTDGSDYSVMVDGMDAETASDGSGWTITTIHGETECDSTLIIHAEVFEGDAPCCPDPGCPGRTCYGGTCTFPGYADNH